MQNMEDPVTNDLDEGYEPIDWFLDFRSGYRWERKALYPKARSYINFRGADIKVPWELSRCQHFGILGVAYLLTGNEKYAREIRNQVIDWVNNNPYCHGPNWNCTMDVGIRAANWLLAYDMIRNSKVKEDWSFLRTMFVSLLQHKEYIWNNLEWSSKLTSNHYLSDIAGLLFIVLYMPQLREVQTLKVFLKREFEKEIYKQTYPDGMDYEGSTGYHRLVLELFAFSALLAERNGLRFENRYYERLRKMFTFTHMLLREDGTIPQIGDNDNGLFFKFYERDLLDHSYISVIGNVFFPAAFAIKRHSGKIEKALFFFGEWTIEDGDQPVSSAFPESGMYVYRNGHVFLTVYNGRNGQNGKGGHNHNDRLSFTLRWNGMEVFIDPGTGVYTPLPDVRNLFRSTGSHSTVMVDCHEQNRYPEDGFLFMLREDIKNVGSKWEAGESGFRFEGIHDGYVKLGEGYVHKRVIRYENENKTMKIDDSFDDGSLTKYAHFVMNAAVEPEVEDNRVIFSCGTMAFNGADSVGMGRMGFSPEYGSIVEDACVKIIVSFANRLKTFVVLK
jgi:hypothetical protein